MPISDTLQECLESYYGLGGKFREQLIEPNILTSIAELGRRQYESIEQLRQKMVMQPQESPAPLQDLSESSTIRELELLPDEVENYDTFVESLCSIAAQLFAVDQQQIRIGQMFKVAGCLTVPLKVEIIGGLPEPTALYVKQSHLLDDPRALGIELFSLIGGFSDFYRYIFDGDVVVEKQVTGTHLHEFPHEQRKTEEYVYGRIGLDILQVFCGLQDIKSDNYVITDNDYAHIPIDFETLEPNSWQQFEFIKQGTIEKLSLMPDEYDTIFDELEFRLAHRVRRKRVKLMQLLEIFRKVGTPTLTLLAADVEEKTGYLIKKYFK